MRSWFLALHFGGATSVLIAVAAILLGLGSLTGGFTTIWATRRRQRRPAAGVRS